MQREAYWSEQETDAVNASARTTYLPLINFPAGSYFSNNFKECDCHDGCDYTVPSNFPSYRCYIENTGTHCSSANQLNGLSSVTAANLKDYFSDVTVGSHVRGKLSSNYFHSIIITEVTNTGISYYQANVGGKCLVSTGTKTWSELASWFLSISKTWVA